MVENILGTPVGFFIDFILDLNLDLVMFIKDTKDGKFISLRKFELYVLQIYIFNEFSL